MASQVSCVQSFENDPVYSKQDRSPRSLASTAYRRTAFNAFLARDNATRLPVVANSSIPSVIDPGSSRAASRCPQRFPSLLHDRVGWFQLNLLMVSSSIALAVRIRSRCRARHQGCYSGQWFGSRRGLLAASVQGPTGVSSPSSCCLATRHSPAPSAIPPNRRSRAPILRSLGTPLETGSNSRPSPILSGVGTVLRRCCNGVAPLHGAGIAASRRHSASEAISPSQHE